MTYEYDWKPFMQYGWACPGCGAVNAPWISQCCCRKPEEYKITCTDNTTYSVSNKSTPNTSTTINNPNIPYTYTMEKL